MRLEQWQPGVELGRVVYPQGAELFVLAGELADEAGRFGPGAWLRLPPGGAHSPSTRAGCMLYIKEGRFGYLNAG